MVRIPLGGLSTVKFIELLVTCKTDGLSKLVAKFYD